MQISTYHSSSFPARILRRIIKLACVICLGLIFIELSLRLLGVHHVVLYLPDRTVGYRIKPMQDIRMGKAHIVINEWGVRDTRCFFQRKPGHRRIIVLGDSVTWGGLAVPQQELFTSVIERQLPECEVINAGVNGYSVFQMTELYRTYLASLAPDLVVVFTISRDFERPPITDLVKNSAAFPTEQPQWAFPVGLVLLRWHVGKLTGWDWLQRVDVSKPRNGESAGPHQLPTHINALKNLQNLMPSPDALWVVVCPTAKQVNQPGLENQIAEQLHTANIPYVLLQDKLTPTPELYLDGVHLSPKGHEVVGKTLAQLLQTWRKKPMAVVNSYEYVYTHEPANNGSGPLWSFGNTQLARINDEAFISQMETGKNVPPLCNTRWQLIKRVNSKWTTVAFAEEFRQREPCPLGLIFPYLYLYVNDSTQPPGTYYGKCVPRLLRFDIRNFDLPPLIIQPQWGTPLPTFNDHSYRGFGVDPENQRLLMLNIDSISAKQHWAYLTADGYTLRTGAITFPIRACYPQVAVQRNQAFVLAIGDIYEPVQEWRAYKYETTQQKWDYVFRILYFTWTPDILSQDFCEPIEIANVDATAGHITNQDLWIAPNSTAYLLYTLRPVASPLMRDRFFPGLSVQNSLHLKKIKNGTVIEEHTLWERSEHRQPTCARFHETPDGKVFVFAYFEGEQNGNYLIQVHPDVHTNEWVSVPFSSPLQSFCVAHRRAGCPPSYVLGVHGFSSSFDSLYYGEVEIR